MPNKKEVNLFPTAYLTNDPHNVKEATEVLEAWGLSQNEKKTRDLIGKKKLNAAHAGNDPNDRRSGYVIHGKDIYEFICSEIPVARQLIKEHHELLKMKAKQESSPKKRQRTKSRNVKQTTIYGTEEALKED